MVSSVIRGWDLCKQRGLPWGGGGKGIVDSTGPQGEAGPAAVHICLLCGEGYGSCMQPKGFKVTDPIPIPPAASELLEDGK